MKTIDLTTQHGRRVTIPADVGVDELDQLAATHERLAADLHEDGRREQALTEEIEAANRRRLDEGAEAMIAGRAKAKASTLAAKLAALEGRLAGARHDGKAKTCARSGRRGDQRTHRDQRGQLGGEVRRGTGSRARDMAGNSRTCRV